MFKNKKVTIMGLGLHGGGAGAAKFFAKHGADVLVTDLKTKDSLQKSLNRLRGLKIKYVLGRHRADDFINADLVIKNPAVPRNSPYLKFAKSNNVPVESDISVFFKLCPGEIIGVTGTKGKSTVATLIFSILKRVWPSTVLAGNIGVSPLEFLGKIKKNSKVVLELSSFELEDLNKSPRMAVMTSILPDHLDRYQSMDEYVAFKKTIFLHQNKNDVLILNYDDKTLRNLAKEASSQVYFYSKKEPLTKKSGRFACHLKGSDIFCGEEGFLVFDVKKLNIFGEHNISNVLAAVSAAFVLGVSVADIAKVLAVFKGVPFRQEFTAEINGAKYFNDTAATMPDAAIAAIETFGGRYANIILIAGGQNKGLDYRELAATINKKIRKLILLPGTASDKIKENLDRGVNVFPAESMEAGVETARRLSQWGDIVLLSPGAASFNLFKNEFDRGEQFNDAVRKIKSSENEE